MTDESKRLPIGPEEVKTAAETLARYKQGKTNLEDRVVDDELWWTLRHWESIGRADGSRAHSISAAAPKSSSAWLFNSLANKHADAMDNYPEPLVLPRERSDEDSAKMLSSVLPVILERNDYEATYDRAWWEKLKHGTAVYGVFWDPSAENGLGDIAIKEIDLLKLFWEPGITDLQQSRNLFIVDLVDEDILDKRYPEHAGKMGGKTIDVQQYRYDDTVDTSGKSTVVDWYYKTQTSGGKTILHYAKFVGDVLLFSSENEEQYQESGWYTHGEYPIVADVLFPEKGTPCGFGYVAICKDPQLYIDKLFSNILENSSMATKRRFFVGGTTNVNEEEFLDWNQPLVHVDGGIDDLHLKEIVVQPLPGIYASIIDMKINELKETSSNRDVNSGGAGSGVTAAAAIAALQEAGNKMSRDMIAASYRAHVGIVRLCIELIRQFYTVRRSFRITGDTPGAYSFVELDNSDIATRPTDPLYEGQEQEGYSPLFRRPIFDIKIRAQKKNPFSRMEQNERAKELYAAGFFNPDRAQEALIALEMMEFEGKDKVVEQVRNGQTLLKTCQQLLQQVGQLLGGLPPGLEASPTTASPAAHEGGHTMGQAVVDASTPMTGYGQRLAARSAPDMNTGSGAPV